MLAAMFLPKTGDELTLDAALQTAADYGMVLCRPANYSPDYPFSCHCFPPERIPNGWRRVVPVVKTPTMATLEESTCHA